MSGKRTDTKGRRTDAAPAVPEPGPRLARCAHLGESPPPLEPLFPLWFKTKQTQNKQNKTEPPKPFYPLLKHSYEDPSKLDEEMRERVLVHRDPLAVQAAGSQGLAHPEREPLPR